VSTATTLSALLKDEEELRDALHLIKLHIEPEAQPGTALDLHNAVQKIVNVARRHGLLVEHGAR
jgi:hypothetical protein